MTYLLNKLKKDSLSILDRFAGKQFIRVRHPFRDNKIEINHFNISRLELLNPIKKEKQNIPLPLILF